MWSFLGIFDPPSPIVVLRRFSRDPPPPKNTRGIFEKKKGFTDSPFT